MSNLSILLKKNNWLLLLFSYVISLAHSQSDHIKRLPLYLFLIMFFRVNYYYFWAIYFLLEETMFEQNSFLKYIKLSFPLHPPSCSCLDNCLLDTCVEKKWNEQLAFPNVSSIVMLRLYRIRGTVRLKSVESGVGIPYPEYAIVIPGSS
jgi:hypothetical protein